MLFSLKVDRLKKLIALGVVFAFALMPTTPVIAAKTDVSIKAPFEEVQILKGDIQVISAKKLKRVSITDPTIADINEAKGDGVDIIGIEPGQTILFIWDETGKRTVVVRVVSEDLGLVKKRVQTLLDEAGFRNLVVSESEHEGKVVITGSFPEEKRDFYLGIIDPFLDRVINLAQKETSNDLVQMDLQITELSKTLDKQLGVNWSTNTAGTETSLLYTENLPDTHIPRANGTFKDLFKLGDFTRTPALIAAINAMIEEGKAKVLSKPRLVVISGKEATFLVGGEVPIKTTTTNATGGSSQENVTFKEYGVSMAITPYIQDNKMINILLSIEVSEIDTTRTSGNDVAFLTRSAHTQLLLEDHQTVVLAGMIKRRNSQNVRRVPFVSRIPVVGMLFRNTKTPTADEETELVISLTPTILRTNKPTKADAAMITPAASASQAKEVVSPAAAVAPSGAAVSAPASLKTPGSAVSPAGVNKQKLSDGMVSVDTETKDDFLPYATAIQKKIASAIAYPYEAQEKGWQGTVTLSMVVQKNGVLKNVAVKQSSGYPVFDQDALNTAQILAPYAAFPTGTALSDVTLSIPIIYSLDAFLKNVTSSN